MTNASGWKRPSRAVDCVGGDGWGGAMFGGMFWWFGAEIASEFMPEFKLCEEDGG
jgi:hypothetical protein